MASVPSCRVWGIGGTKGGRGLRVPAVCTHPCPVPAARVPARRESRALRKLHRNVTLGRLAAANVNKVHV